MSWFQGLIAAIAYWFSRKKDRSSQIRQGMPSSKFYRPRGPDDPIYRMPDGKWWINVQQLNLGPFDTETQARAHLRNEVVR